MTYLTTTQMQTLLVDVCEQYLNFLNLAHPILKKQIWANSAKQRLKGSTDYTQSTFSLESISIN